jgi:hypothetical protein
MRVAIPEHVPLPRQPGSENPPLWTLSAAREVGEDEMASLLGADERVINL